MMALKKSIPRSTGRDPKKVGDEEELVPINDIAEELGISPKTARSRLRRELGKRHGWKFSQREVPAVKRLIK